MRVFLIIFLIGFCLRSNGQKIDRTKSQAKKLSNQIYKKIKKGAHFSTMQRIYSDNQQTASANNGIMSIVKPYNLDHSLYFDLLLKTKVGSCSKPFNFISAKWYVIVNILERDSLSMKYRLIATYYK